MIFAKYPPENISEAITVFKQDVELAHGVVHGDEYTEVLTENGLVPSFQKVIKYLEDEVAGATGIDVSLRNDLATVGSDVVISGVEAKDLVIRPTSSAEIAALTLPNGFFFQVASGAVDHFRRVDALDDGTGIFLASGNYANLMLTNELKIYMSQLFVGGGDQTNLIINKLPAKIAAEGINEIVLDTGDISVTGTLPDIYGGVTFSGKGKLLVSDLNNVLQRTQSQKTESKKYHGGFNVGAVYNTIAKAQVQKKKELRIVLVGDSISVGSDYDSFGAILSGARASSGVDNVVRDNCFAATLFNEICAIIPQEVRVKFYSRSVGGLGYSSLNLAWDSIGALWSGREQVTAGKTWRDCVLDLNPDLVIHAMGMNESPASYVDNFVLNWQNYLFDEQKTLSFDQVIVTTPNPNFIDASPFGDFKQYGFNAQKFFVGSLQRYIAKKYNYSLIDVAFNSYLKRYGIDVRSANYQAIPDVMTFPDSSTSKVVAIGTAPSLYEVTPKTLPLYWSFDFVLNCAAPSNTAGFDFKLTAGSIILQIAGGVITLISANYGSLGLFTKSYSQVLTESVNYGFTVTVTPTSIYVYLDGALIIAMSDAPFTGTLPIQFDNSGGSVNVAVVSGNIYGVQFARYGADAVTNGDYYGVLDFTQNPNGGGVNHPSSTMLAEVYLPPAREYLTELLKASIEYDTVVGGTSAGQMIFIGRILNKQYNRVSIKDFGSGRETIVEVTGATSWNVIKNTGGGVSIYIDPSDMSMFLFNPSDPVLQIEYTGDWLVKRPVKLGIATPRGTLLVTVP